MHYPGVVSDVAHLFWDVQRSLYHQHLSAAEIPLKFPMLSQAPSAYTVADICRDGCRSLQPDELRRITPRVHRAVHAIQALVQGFTEAPLVVDAINVVVLTNKAIEFNNSWTVGTTIVLAHADVVEHEVCHVYQRNFPTAFERFYMRATDRHFIRLAWEDVQKVVAEVPAMDNPDCSVHASWQYAYVWTENGRKRCVLPLLDRQDVSPMLVDLNLDWDSYASKVEGVRRRTSQLVDFHGHRLPLDHPHEMFASWVAMQLRSPAPAGGFLPR